jgi:hypothetical protein
VTFKNTTTSNELYPVANATTSSSPFVDIFMNRDPTTSDTNYAVQKKWLNTTTNNLWMLKGFTSTSGNIQAVWISFVAGANGVTQVTVDTFTAPGTNPVVPSSGNITITGGQVAAGTTSNVIETNSLAANTFTIDVQRSQAVASSTVGDNGVCHFDSSLFTVDTNGFVSMSSSPLLNLNVQTGTSPVTPTSGALTFNGAVVAAGTHPVRTDGTAAHTVALEVQTSQAIASTDATKIGLSAFDSSKFTVDANGFVSANGSGLGETITGNSGGALSPTAGNWNIFGGTGISTSGSGSTLTINATGGGFTWNDITGTSASMVVNNGYLADNAGLVTLTLPATAAQFSAIVVAGHGAGGWTIAQNANQKIIFGSTATTTGASGSLSSSNANDVVFLLAVVGGASTQWMVLSSVGNITVV